MFAVSHNFGDFMLNKVYNLLMDSESRCKPVPLHPLSLLPSGMLLRSERAVAGGGLAPNPLAVCHRGMDLKSAP